jgi:hypothetical protein
MKELLRDVKCKGSGFSGSSRRNGYLHLNLCEELERKLYAAARPRFGAGPKTAALTGFAY